MRACHQILTNQLISVVRTLPEEIIERITLVEAKNYLKVDYNEDDDLIEMLIVSAREWLEKYCGICVIGQDVDMVIEVMNRMQIPYGPVSLTTLVVTDDLTNEVIASPNVVGLDFSFPEISGYGRYRLEFQGGYGPFPTQLKLAMLAKIASSYEHRGDELEESNVDYARIAKENAKPFKRTVGF